MSFSENRICEQVSNYRISNRTGSNLAASSKADNGKMYKIYIIASKLIGINMVTLKV